MPSIAEYERAAALAGLYRRRYGADAEIFIAMRADAALDRGALRVRRLWLLVLAALDSQRRGHKTPTPKAAPMPSRTDNIRAETTTPSLDTGRPTS